MKSRATGPALADQDRDSALGGSKSRFVGEIVTEEENQRRTGSGFGECTADGSAFAGHAMGHHFQVAQVLKQIKCAAKRLEKGTHCSASQLARARPCM